MTTNRVLVAVCLALLLSAPAAAVERDGRWEVTVQIVGNSSEDAGSDNGSGVDVDSDLGFGAGAAYNFNERFAVGFDFTYLSPDYTATFVLDNGTGNSVSFDHELDVFSGMFSGTWNILPGRITPYLEIAGGWTYIDTNITDGPPTTGCWWDPWWGYICADFYDTYDDTTFTWGGGAGMRFEFGERMFLKGSYNRVELDTDGADPTFDLWKAELGWIL